MVAEARNSCPGRQMIRLALIAICLTALPVGAEEVKHSPMEQALAGKLSEEYKANLQCRAQLIAANAEIAAAKKTTAPPPLPAEAPHQGPPPSRHE